MIIRDINGKDITPENFERIVIYGNGKKLFTNDSSTIKSYTIKENRYNHESLSDDYNGGPIEITLKNGIKRANKENLNRKDNYTLTYTPDYCTWEKRKAIYIHESEIEITDLGNITAMETEEERNYLHACLLKFNGTTKFQRFHIERIPCDDTWKLPENARWGSGYGPENRPEYSTYDNSKSVFAAKKGLDPNERGVVKRWFTIETIITGAEIVAAERYYTKTEYSKERERKNDLAKALNESGIFGNKTFSHYDIEKLEKVFNITLKTEG